jgi:hypothetical protein
MKEEESACISEISMLQYQYRKLIATTRKSNRHYTIVPALERR